MNKFGRVEDTAMNRVMNENIEKRKAYGKGDRETIVEAYDDCKTWVTPEFLSQFIREWEAARKYILKHAERKTKPASMSDSQEVARLKHGVITYPREYWV